MADRRKRYRSNLAKAAEWAIAQAPYEAARIREAKSRITLCKCNRVIRSAEADREKAGWDGGR